METCQLCKSVFASKKSIQMHLNKSHAYNINDIKLYYDTYYKLANEGSDPFTGGATKFIGLTKGYAKFDGSDESNKKKIASSTVEYWVKVKGYSEEDAIAYLKLKHKKSTENANKTKKELLIENPERRFFGGYGKRKFILMGYTNEEAQKKYEDITAKRTPKLIESLSSVDWSGKRMGQIEYWTNKGYSIEAAKLKVSNIQTTFTLVKCIKKYGEEKGLTVFNKRQEKWKQSLQANFSKFGDGRSPSSKFASSIITILCEYLNIEVPKKEKWIKDKQSKKAYSYDFTYNKKIIEFNGDYWHCNPNIYEADYFNKRKLLNAKQIWEYDEQKIKTANKYGYQVFIVWESDFKNNPEEVIEKCIQFIND